jgi:hypothetical protein
MSDEMISVIDVANQLGKRKQTIFKIARRLGISGLKRRDSSSRNQLVLYITQSDFKLIKGEVLANERRMQSNQLEIDDGEDFVSAEQGVFYLIQLEADHDPGRFKVGFAASMSERLRALRCSAPFANVLKTWPCRRLWEKTAIDCVAAGCEQIHTEVFRTDSLETVAAKCEQFFGMMPVLVTPEAPVAMELNVLVQ